MLRIATAMRGLWLTIWRAASTPFKCGMAISITTTSGSSAAARVDRFAAVGRLAHHLQIRLALQQQAQAVAHHGVVVGQKYPDRSVVGHVIAVILLAHP